MGFIEILWGVAFLIVPILIAWGLFMLTPPINKTAASILFVIAPLPLIIMDVVYVVTTADSWAKRVLVSGIIGALAAIAAIEQIRIMLGRKDK